MSKTKRGPGRQPLDPQDVQRGRNVAINDRLWKSVRARCKLDGVSLSEFVREALERRLAR